MFSDTGCSFELAGGVMSTSNQRVLVKDLNMGAVFTRSFDHAYPVAVRADGMYIYDDSGKAYLDMCGGAAVSCLGHRHPDVIAALHRQIDNMAFAHTAFFTNGPQEQLAMALTSRFGEDGARAYFTAGGSEANETAVKMAWQYWRAAGKPQKTKIISREHSYHGNTFGALSVSGNPARRQPLNGLLMNWPRIAPCFAYRYKNAGESELEYGLRAANALEEAILKAGADTVAAFIVEPVVGASLGAAVAAKGYFKRVREICDTYDVLLIADEIMCGTGRTGTFYAHEQEGILPDIVTLAKGIGGGYQPLAATIARRHIVERFSDKSSPFDHGHTYVGHASTCAAGAAVVNVIEKHQLLGAVSRMGALLQQALEDALLDHPNVGDIRGRGLFRAIELVADKSRKIPLESGPATAKAIKNTAMKHGLMIYPSGGRREDGLSAHILLAPPFILSPNHIEELVCKLEVTLGGVFRA